MAKLGDPFDGGSNKGGLIFDFMVLYHTDGAQVAVTDRKSYMGF